jgi:flagellin
MIINHNLMALNTHRQMGVNNAGTSKSLEKLSSGYRINRAGDDAAGLAISEKMRGQIRGLNQASRNAQDGISLIQTAEGALNETHSILQRMRELAVQSATDTNTDADRAKIQSEVDQLATEITRISNTTEFNTRNLLAGGLNTIFHIGANQGQNVDLTIEAMDAFSLGVAGDAVELALNSGGTAGVTGVEGTVAATADGTITISAATTAVSGGSGFDITINDGTGSGANSVVLSNVAADATSITGTGYFAGLTVSFDTIASGSSTVAVTVTAASAAVTDTGGTLTTPAVAVAGVDVSTQAAADAAITTINNALEKVSAERSKLGAAQNRLEHTIANLDTSAENLQASESRIRDVDMAKEMMEFTKNSILQQAATAMLAQANQQPQTVLQLLR